MGAGEGQPPQLISVQPPGFPGLRFNGVIEMDSKNFERDPVTRNRVLDRKERVQLCRRGAEEHLRRFPRVRIL